MMVFPHRMTALPHRLITALVLAMIAPCAQAQPAFELELLTPTELRVAPGESVAHGIRISNIGNVSGPARLLGTWAPYWSEYPVGEYLLGPAPDPRCGTIENPTGAVLAIEFTTAALEPGQSLDCRWMVSRPVQAPALDAVIAWSNQSSPDAPTPLTVLGTLTNTAISTNTRSFHVDAQGIGRSTVELSVQNLGEHSIDSQITQSCPPIAPLGSNHVVIEDSFGPGGCGQVRDDGFLGGCATSLDDGPFGYLVPELQAGQIYRCTFIARTQLPYSNPLSREMSHTRTQVSASAGYLIDTNSGDSVSNIVVGPTGSLGGTVALDSLDRLALLALGLSIAIFAMMSLSRMQSRRYRASR